MVPGIGSARLQSLLEACETPLGAISAPVALLRAIPGITQAAASAIAAARVEDGAQILEQTERLGGRVLLPDDAEFPESLREVSEPPPVLFALGNLGLLQSPAVAIVGSRDHSGYGAEVARQFGWEASAAGIVVVSGMARGLDAVAHTAALDAGGGTIGVLGNGLGVTYPAANRALYLRVAQQGLLLTEFPPGERPTAGSFPRRNRVISGLARVTVVIEAAEGSGALITAGTALDQGKDVMVVPGNITSPLSVGANRLIRDGAAPLLEPADLLSHFPDAEPIASPAPLPPALQPLPATLAPSERTVAERLGQEPVLLDELVARLGLPPQELLAALCTLEIAGVVEQRPGRLFRRI